MGDRQGEGLGDEDGMLMTLASISIANGYKYCYSCKTNQKKRDHEAIPLFLQRLLVSHSCQPAYFFFGVSNGSLDMVRTGRSRLR